MAGLPHFTNIKASYSDPIFSSLFEVRFNFLNGNYLTDNLHKINEKYCHFNINQVNNGEVIVLRLIDELIRNQTKLYVEILLYKKTGEVLQVIVLEGFTFTKFKKLLDFSYSDQNIVKPKVRFKYDSMKLYFDYKQYTRRKKLERLQCL